MDGHSRNYIIQSSCYKICFQSIDKCISCTKKNWTSSSSWIINKRNLSWFNFDYTTHSFQFFSYWNIVCYFGNYISYLLITHVYSWLWIEIIKVMSLNFKIDKIYEQEKIMWLVLWTTSMCLKWRIHMYV